MEIRLSLINKMDEAKSTTTIGEPQFPTRINLGCGRQRLQGYCNIDIVPFTDFNGGQAVDMVMDIEKEQLPFECNVMDEIRAYNIFEHLGEGFIFALNECHRVLKATGYLVGCVPLAGSDIDFGDITHKRHFNKRSFSYLCGINPAMPIRPSHPKYADYGVLPWIEGEIVIQDDIIFFNLKPRKI